MAVLEQWPAAWAAASTATLQPCGPAVICRCWQRGGEIEEIVISPQIGISPQPCGDAARCALLHRLVDPPPCTPFALPCISFAIPSARCSLAVWWLEALTAGAAAALASPSGVAHASRGGRAAGSSGGATASVLRRVGPGLEFGRRRRAAAAAGPVVTWRRWRDS